MNAVPLSSMMPVLPELVLAVGAMALLMLGVYRERTDSTISILSVVLLAVAGYVVVAIPNGTSPSRSWPI